MQYDAAVIGGGIAGLQAALTLGRARRTVLLLDAGQPRHRFASHMHNMLGADGLSIDEFYARAHAELANYPNVTFVRSALVSVSGANGAFTLGDAQGTTHTARKMLFAMGVLDVLPQIPGLVEAWGNEVLHCAYCHGYEQAGKILGALVNVGNARAVLESLFALQAPLQFYFERDSAPDEALLTKLASKGVNVELQPVESITRNGQGLTLALADGRNAAVDALFVKPFSAAPSILPFELGCGLNDNAFIAVNEWGNTHAAGVFAAGDIAGGFQQLVEAQHSGLRAAVSLNTELTRAALA